jgi:hypothetical protein
MKLNSDDSLSEATTSSGKPKQDVASVLLYHSHHRCGIRLLWTSYQDTRRQDQVSSREAHKKLRPARGNNAKIILGQNINL